MMEFYLQVQNKIILLMLVFFAAVSKAEERPYFEEIDKVDIKENPYLVDMKVTHDGQYLLASISSASSKDGNSVIHVYKLLSNKKISKTPVSSIHSNAWNQPLTSVSTLQLINSDDNDFVHVYVYSLANDENMSSVASISGYQMSADGILSSLPGAQIMLDGYSPLFFIPGNKVMHIQDKLIFAVEYNAIAVINLHSDGSLSVKHHIALSSVKPNSPASLAYFSAMGQLVIVFGLYGEKPHNENIALQIMSVDNSGNHNETDQEYRWYFSKNASFVEIFTALAEPCGGESKAIISISGVQKNKFNIKQDSFNLLIVDVEKYHVVQNKLNFGVASLEYGRTRDRFYIGGEVNKGCSTISLSAHKIQNNHSVHLIADSAINTTHTYWGLSLTPDGCHLIAVAGGGFIESEATSSLILYQINDPEINCTAPMTPIYFDLTVSIPSVTVVITALSLTIIIGCYLARKYGARRGYIPIND